MDSDRRCFSRTERRPCHEWSCPISAYRVHPDISGQLAPDRSPDRGLRKRPYDLIREGLIALVAVFVLVAAFAGFLSSSVEPPLTLQQYAQQNPVDFVTTAMKELGGTSVIAQYGPPYNQGTGSVQSIGPLSLQQVALHQALKHVHNDRGDHRRRTGGRARIESLPEAAGHRTLRHPTTLPRAALGSCQIGGYCADMVSRWLWAVLSITGWLTSRAYASSNV